MADMSYPSSPTDTRELPPPLRPVTAKHERNFEEALKIAKSIKVSMNKDVVSQRAVEYLVEEAYSEKLLESLREGGEIDRRLTSEGYLAPLDGYFKYRDKEQATSRDMSLVSTQSDSQGHSKDDDEMSDSDSSLDSGFFDLEVADVVGPPAETEQEQIVLGAHLVQALKCHFAMYYRCMLEQNMALKEAMRESNLNIAMLTYRRFAGSTDSVMFVELKELQTQAPQGIYMKGTVVKSLDPLVVKYSVFCHGHLYMRNGEYIAVVQVHKKKLPRRLAFAVDTKQIGENFDNFPEFESRRHIQY